MGTADARYLAPGVITIGSGGPAAFFVPVPAIVHWPEVHDNAQPCSLFHPGTLAAGATLQ
jgi:hypothetical protein